MASTNSKNLASGTLVGNITASATSITVNVGASNVTAVSGAWPAVPFYATLMPASPSIGVANSLNSEIVKVTAVTYNSSYNSVLTITRAQKGTTAKAFTAGAVVTNAYYTEDTPAYAYAKIVYIGKVGFKKQTYSNARLVLENKTDFFTATGVSCAINSNTNLKFTLPTSGSYVAKVRSSLWTNGNSWDYMLFQNEKNYNTFSRNMAPKINGGWGFVCTEGYTTIANGDFLNVYLNTNGNNFSDGNISNADSCMLVEIYEVG